MVDINNKNLAALSSILIITLVLSGCDPAAEEQQVQEIISTQMAETAVFETAVVALLTQRAPTLTNTPPPSLTPTITLTPTVTETVMRDPWVLQDFCIKEPGQCVPYTFNNAKYNSWITIKLTHLESGISGEFSVQPMTIATITLIPGEYEGIYDGWCAGYIMRLIRVAELGAETGRLRC